MPPYDKSILVEPREQKSEYLETVSGITHLRRPFCCPSFSHEDRQPSLSKNPCASFVHCFSCGSSVDVFEISGWAERAMSFPEKAKANVTKGVLP